MIFINSRFLTQPTTGVQRYAIELSIRLKQIDPSIQFICPENVLHNDIFEKLGAKIIGTKTGHLWEQIDLPRFLKKNGNPILINLCNTAPAFYKNKISVLHDIIYKLYPQSCSLLFRLWYLMLIPRVVKTSLKLITVSEFSREEISNNFGYPKDKISIVYNAVNKNFHSIGKKENTTPYLLAVSSITYHKNYDRMVKAFIQLYNSGNININLFVIGGTSNSFAKQNYDVSNIPIYFQGRVSDEKLIELYQNAEAFVFPSLYEGFGIPPLEAQACGCPVISSNTAAMPEILGDSVIYFDPENIDDIQNAMYSIINNIQLKESLIKKGHENVSRFSWNESAQKLYQIILDVSKKRV